MDSPQPTPGASEPFVLTGQQMLELAAARRACRPVSRAVRVAALSGWTMAMFAAITLTVGLSTITATWMGLAMTVAAFVELRAGRRLRRLHPSAARTLGCNQLVLGLLIVLYAAWNIETLRLAAPQPMDISFNTSGAAWHFTPNNPMFLREFEIVLYAVMAAVALLTQGVSAWYYFSRDKWIRLYVSHAPQWILQIQRAGVSF